MVLILICWGKCNHTSPHPNQYLTHTIHFSGRTPYDRCREDIRGCRLPFTVSMVCRPKARAVMFGAACNQDKPLMDTIHACDPHLLGMNIHVSNETGRSSFVGVYLFLICGFLFFTKHLFNVFVFVVCVCHGDHSPRAACILTKAAYDTSCQPRHNGILCSTHLLLGIVLGCGGSQAALLGIVLGSHCIGSHASIVAEP